MFKASLLMLAIGTASASTIATVNCDGSILSDANFAMCTVFPGGQAHVSASAAVASFDVSAQAAASDFPHFAIAEARQSGTYLFTVTGGTGGGFFLPCVSAAAYDGGEADARFGNYGSPVGTRRGADLCTYEDLSSATPFTYGEGQPFTISLYAHAQSGQCFYGPCSSANAGFGYAYFPLFEFWDSQGNRTNASFTLVEIPEPYTFALSGVALAALALAALRSRRRGHFLRFGRI